MCRVIKDQNIKEDCPPDMIVNWNALEMLKIKYLGTKDFAVSEDTINELLTNLIYCISIVEAIRHGKDYTLTHIHKNNEDATDEIN